MDAVGEGGSSSKRVDGEVVIVVRCCKRSSCPRLSASPSCRQRQFLSSDPSQRVGPDARYYSELFSRSGQLEQVRAELVNSRPQTLGTALCTLNSSNESLSDRSPPFQSAMRGSSCRSEASPSVFGPATRIARKTCCNQNKQNIGAIPRQVNTLPSSSPPSAFGSTSTAMRVPSALLFSGRPSGP